MVHDLCNAQRILRRSGVAQIFIRGHQYPELVAEVNRLATSRKLRFIVPFDIEAHASSRWCRWVSEWVLVWPEIEHAAMWEHRGALGRVVERACECPSW